MFHQPNTAVLVRVTRFDMAGRHDAVEFSHIHLNGRFLFGRSDKSYFSCPDNGLG